MNAAFWHQPIVIRLITLCLILGLSGSAVFPVMSTHLALDLAVEPTWIGVFFTLNTLAGMITSHLLAKRSDTGLSRLSLLYSALLASIIGALLFSVVETFWLLLIIGIGWFGLSASSQPQLFALAREQVKAQQAALFQSVLRATIALSWIAGPPLAYWLYSRFGFSTLMGFAAALFALALCLLPGLKDAKLADNSAPASLRDRRISRLIVVMTALFAANAMYLVYMPLYLHEELRLADTTPGLLMGVAAGLEIPIMIVAGKYASRWSLFGPLWLASACGCILYTGMWWADSLWVLVSLQIFNAGLVGLAAGLGMHIFQSLLTGRAGMATTLYTNSIKLGSLVGVSLGGLVAQYQGYRMTFVLCAIMTVLALMVVTRLVRQPVTRP